MEPDDIRTQQRETWDTFSTGWRKWDALVMDMLQPACATMVERVNPAEDASHLDVATGTGEPGLTIAARASKGRVVLSDLSLGMLKGARRTVAERGLAHVEVHEADAGALPFDDASFDSVTCRFGFMFFPDMAAAAHEFSRVLRPGGVASVAVWAEREVNPWATIPLREIAKVVDMPADPPGAPGLFRCADPGFMVRLFESAGFVAVADENVDLAVTVTPPEMYWDYMAEVAAPVVAGLSLTDDAGRERIRAATLEAMRRYESEGRLVAPGVARVTTVRKN